MCCSFIILSQKHSSLYPSSQRRIYTFHGPRSFTAAGFLLKVSKSKSGLSSARVPALQKVITPPGRQHWEKVVPPPEANIEKSGLRNSLFWGLSGPLILRGPQLPPPAPVLKFGPASS